MTATDAMTFADLVEQWPAVVGAPLAERLKACAFDIGGVLTVRATQTIAPTDLAAVSSSLLARLPSHIDGVACRRIRFLPPEHAPYKPPTKRKP
ncbi:MAG TPA: DciA family protein [Gemmatimonadaceae bacterium]|nr:DciA family protein [Gemmatimonadaceae bacterium]